MGCGEVVERGDDLGVGEGGIEWDEDGAEFEQRIRDLYSSGRCLR